MSTLRILTTTAIILIVNIISTEAYAQSSSLSKNNAAEVSDVSNKVNNPDIAPASTQEEKPHVIDEQGEKVYFLADPGITKGDASMQDQQKKELDPLLPENKTENHVRKPQ